MNAILRNTWTILHAKERRKFVMLIVLEIVMNIVDILSLVALLWIVKFYVTPANKNDIPYLSDWWYDRSSVKPIGVFLILFALKNAAGYLITRSTYKFNGDVAVRISQIHMRSYQRSPFSEFVNVDSSVHIRKIAFQPYEFCQYVLAGIQQIITQSSLILFSIAAIILFNAKLFLLLLLILLPPALIIFYLIKKTSEKNRKGIQQSNEISFRYLLDALKGYIESNIYGKNKFFSDRFIAERRSFSKYLFNSISLQSLPSRFIEVFAILGLFLLIVISKFSDQQTAPLLLVGAFVAAAYKIIPGIVKIINAAAQVKAYEFAVNDLVKEIPVSEETEENETERIESVHFKNVQFHFGNVSVLNNFNFCMQSGDFIGITGRSGIGKTTVLNMLTGFLEPEHGELFFNGNKVNARAIKSFWPQFSFVRQQSFLINDSILKNIVLSEGDYDKAKLETIIDVTGLDQLLGNYLEGIEMQITENGKNISGGQQQRIGIARALYHDASIYLLDEPFNELDEASETALLQYFQRLSQQGKTVVMVTHNKAALSYCNKIISLNG